ncbi:NACHT domain-containing protein [Nonomuraea lactucae]|uniref:NACHT domain-containing protein n=1 Tax=Nonomuraea lactucae TaxID=2249762 RepID=UPI000DE4B642|nr:NACHT domain-containing protein [Nonomuraea lactucae]
MGWGARGVAAAGTVAVAAAVNVTAGMLTQQWDVAWLAATGVLVVAGGGLQAWLIVAEGSGRSDGVDERLARAAELLAEEVGVRLRGETERRDLGRPAPISLTVRPTGRPVQALPEALLGGIGPIGHAAVDGAEGVADLFRGLPIRQLVILGEPGAGKTVLAMLLTLALLRERSAGALVPVFLPMASWNPDTRLDTWMADRLVEDYPVLARSYGRGTARRLVETGRVLPVLDGLDEITASSFEEVIKRVDLVFPDGAGFVLTCRAQEFEAAVVEFDVPLSRATIMEIERVTARSAIAYLPATSLDRDRWEPLLDRLRAEPDGPLATALTTPLMLYLVRTTYEHPGTRPAELLDVSRFGTARAIEEHLLDAFVPATYAPYHGLPYAPVQAGRWLGTLAHAPRELRWWNLASGDGVLLTVLILAACAGWASHLVLGPMFGFLMGALVFFSYPQVEEWLDLDRLNVVAGERETGVRAQLRAYRMFAGFCAAAAGVLTGGIVGAALGGGLGAEAATVRLYVVAGGVAFGLMTLIGTAWGAFFLTRVGLAFAGRLPLRLLRFMEDAHRRGVLRQPGVAYQFRHARLQDRLRATAGPSPFRVAHYGAAGAGPRLGMFVRLLYAPLLRLAIHVSVVVVPAALLAVLPFIEYVHHHSGVRPEVDDRSVCGGPNGACVVSFTWRWSLPPAGGSTSRVSVKQYFFMSPAYGGLGGDIAVEGCPAASVLMSVSADGFGAPAVRRTLGGRQEVDLGELDWPLPKRFETLTVAFRRLDAAPCTAVIAWHNPHFSVDQIFDFRARFE